MDHKFSIFGYKFLVFSYLHMDSHLSFLLLMLFAALEKYIYIYFNKKRTAKLVKMLQSFLHRPLLFVVMYAAVKYL